MHGLKALQGHGRRRQDHRHATARRSGRGVKNSAVAQNNPLEADAEHGVQNRSIDEIARRTVGGDAPALDDHHALKQAEGQIEIVHLLVEAGTDVNCHPGANTPLVAAIEARNVALMNYLEERGAREKP